MRKALRILSRLILATSLLLCIAASVLWIRSHWVQDLWRYQTVSRPADASCYTVFSLRSDDGVFSLERDIVGNGPAETSFEHDVPLNSGFFHLSFRDNVGHNFADPGFRWHGIPIGHDSFHPPIEGFYVGPQRVDSSKTYSSVWAPDWLLVGILFALVIAGLIRWRHRAKRQRLRGFAVMAKGLGDQRMK